MMDHGRRNRLIVGGKLFIALALDNGLLPGTMAAEPLPLSFPFSRGQALAASS